MKSLQKIMLVFILFILSTSPACFPENSSAGGGLEETSQTSSQSDENQGSLDSLADLPLNPSVGEPQGQTVPGNPELSPNAATISLFSMGANYAEINKIRLSSTPNPNALQLSVYKLGGDPENSPLWQHVFKRSGDLIDTKELKFWYRDDQVFSIQRQGESLVLRNSENEAIGKI